MRTCALDLGGTTVKMVVDCTRRGRSETTFPAPQSAGDLAGILSTVGEAPDALGVALPGVISEDGRAMVGAHGKYGWLLGVDAVRLLATLSGVPESRIVVENDARAALWGELSPGGCAAGARDAVMVVLGTGIGTAVVHDGALLRGRSGHAGILGGHVTVDLDGAPCSCGNVGCAETVAGTWALARRAASHPGFHASPLSALPAFGVRHVLEAASGGDRCASWLLDGCVDAWSAVVVTLCHLVDPEVVVLSGGPMLAATSILPALRARVADRLWAGMPRPELRVPDDPVNAVARGMLVLASDLYGQGEPPRD